MAFLNRSLTSFFFPIYINSSYQRTFPINSPRGLISNNYLQRRKQRNGLLFYLLHNLHCTLNVLGNLSSAVDFLYYNYLTYTILYTPISHHRYINLYLIIINITLSIFNKHCRLGN